MGEQGFGRTIVILAVFGCIKVSLGQRCESAGYTLIADPQRSTNATIGTPLYKAICDDHLVEDLWYRFDSYVGSTIPERAPNDSVPMYKCGTVNPVYIVGLNSHPTKDNQTTFAAVRGGYNAYLNISLWNATIQIHKCPAQENRQSYFLYKLKKVPWCDIAYCAGEGVPCKREYYWNGSTCVELRSDTLVITAYQQVRRFFIDGVAVDNLNSDGDPNTPDYINMKPNTRLIALDAVNNGILTCGGVLAATVGQTIITDSRFICFDSYSSDWMKLGYLGDSYGAPALEYGNNTGGRINCSQYGPIADIVPDAKWIWQNNFGDPAVVCRGYTNFCETSSPCLNGGTCLKNSPEMCSCSPQFTGKYCETALPDPCENYQFINMADGFRSSDFDSSDASIALCDVYAINNGTWYRFEHQSGNRLIKGPINPWHCGTEAPIWLNGEHPTDAIEKTVQACATYDSNRTCQWSGSVSIRRCNLYGETFYVYLLPVPPGCPLSYCVDAASRRNCTPPEIWINDKYRCGASTTVPTTAPIIPTTTTFAPTPTFSPDGWRNWEHWSECSRTCDYGLQTRRRICDQSRLPCNGPSTMSQPCSGKNCQTPRIPDEQNNGVVLILGSSEAENDTLSLVIRNQDIIYELLRVSLNRICSENVSLCCGSNYTGNDTREFEFVITGDVYQVPGRLHEVPGGNVSMQIVAVVDEIVDQKVCRSDSQSITSRRKRAVRKRFLSFSTLLKAIINAAESILKATGLIVGKTDRPPKDDDGQSPNDCPVSDCVVPLVIAILGTIGAIAGLVTAVLKRNQRKRSKKNSSEDSSSNARNDAKNKNRTNKNKGSKERSPKNSPSSATNDAKNKNRTNKKPGIRTKKPPQRSSSSSPPPSSPPPSLPPSSPPSPSSSPPPSPTPSATPPPRSPPPSYATIKIKSKPHKSRKGTDTDPSQESSFSMTSPENDSNEKKGTDTDPSQESSISMTSPKNDSNDTNEKKGTDTDSSQESSFTMTSPKNDSNDPNEKKEIKPAQLSPPKQNNNLYRGHFQIKVEGKGYGPTESNA